MVEFFIVRRENRTFFIQLEAPSFFTPGELVFLREDALEFFIREHAIVDEDLRVIIPADKTEPLGFVIFFGRAVDRDAISVGIFLAAAPDREDWDLLRFKCLPEAFTDLAFFPF